MIVLAQQSPNITYNPKMTMKKILKTNTTQPKKPSNNSKPNKKNMKNN